MKFKHAQEFSISSNLLVNPSTRVTDYRPISFTIVCANCFSKRKLIPWLKLILRNQTLLESSYHSWSYTVSTGIYLLMRVCAMC